MRTRTRTRTRTANTAAITLYNLLVGAIARVFDVAETASPKPGNGGLKLLKAVSSVIGEEGIVPEGGGAGVCGSASVAERYFDAWKPPPARPRGNSTRGTAVIWQTACRSSRRTQGK